MWDFNRLIWVRLVVASRLLYTLALVVPLKEYEGVVDDTKKKLFYPYHGEGCTARDLASRSRGSGPTGQGLQEGSNLPEWHYENNDGTEQRSSILLT